MFRRSYFSYLFLFHLFLGSCQQKKNSDLLTIQQLSNSLHEISGITMLPNDGNIYAINDSGNKNVVFTLNFEGNIQKEILIPNTTNVDWEDLTYDIDNNLYIGDFGNNDNERKNLAIYKVADIFSETPQTSKISFVLNDQKKFPPKKKNRNFDIEAFIHRDGYFYLFTKNRSTKFKGETKLYKVKNKPGKQIAKLITTYKTCKDAADCFISSAAINTEGDKIALLTYNKVLILSNFSGDNVFNGDIETIRLRHFSQKEGICFKNDSTLFIVDEHSKKLKGYLYKFNL